LVSLSYKFQNVLQGGLKELRSGVLKPEVKPWIGELILKLSPGLGFELICWMLGLLELIY